MAQLQAGKFNTQQKALHQKLQDGFCFTAKTHMQTCRRCNPFVHMVAGEIVGREENNADLARALVQTKTELSKLQIEYAKCSNAQTELNQFKMMYPQLGGGSLVTNANAQLPVTKPVGIDNLLTNHALEHPERLAHTLSANPNTVDYWPLPTNYGRGRGRGRAGSFRGRPRGSRNNFGSWRNKPYERQTYDYDEQNDWHQEQKVVVVYQNENTAALASMSPGHPNAFLGTNTSVSGITTTAEQMAQLAVKQPAFQPPTYAATATQMDQALPVELESATPAARVTVDSDQATTSSQMDNA